ncbi:hypothetical protein HOE04_04455 [archaeon]|jgi:hypothetical protein|nr:hypothetical protein [archaeon]
MSFTTLLQKVQESETFQNFKQQNPDAQLVAGFFILDFLSNDNKETLDYKTKDDIFTFTLKDNKIKINKDKLIDDPTRPQLTEIQQQIKIDTTELKNLVGLKALDNGISAKLNKIIAVLQTYNQKQIWNLTCMLENLIILNIHIDSNTGEITKFERKSMMDMIKKVK